MNMSCNVFNERSFSKLHMYLLILAEYGKPSPRMETLVKRFILGLKMIFQDISYMGTQISTRPFFITGYDEKKTI